MITSIAASIICISCDFKTTTPWVTDMVCRHIARLGEFLRIAFGTTKITAAFCVICPDCLRSLAFSNEDEELDYVYSKAKEMDIMGGIRKNNEVSEVCTYNMAKQRLKNVTPIIEVRQTVSVLVDEWL